MTTDYGVERRGTDERRWTVWGYTRDGAERAVAATRGAGWSHGAVAVRSRRVDDDSEGQQ